MGTEDYVEGLEPSSGALMGRDIPSSTLATLRGILISSLSRENLGNIDAPAVQSRRRVTFQELNMDAGAAPVDANQRPATNVRPHSNRGKDNGSASQKEREERIRMLRDRQNDDRQKKLEELKQQALAAQKFREQKEEERRRRIDELRQRDTDRRHQVEERKRQIWEAERDRREAILRKNQEREARIDTKRKNERSSIVFAFGSSTPRMLEPADTGGSFWGTRRATSTTNVMMFTAMPLTRRSSERELDGSKKRATSASGLDRKPGEDMKMSTSMYGVFHWNSSPEPNSVPPLRAKSPSPRSEPNPSVGGPPSRAASIFSGEEVDSASPSFNSSTRVNRRKTDLMPTIPSPRDLTPTSGSRPSQRPFSRSPGRAYSMSRLDQLSQPRRRPELSALHEQPPPPLGSSPSMSRSMSHLAGTGKPRGTTLRRSEASRSMSQLSGGTPVPPPRPTRAERLRRRAREAAKPTGSGQQPGLRSGEITPTRPLSALSQQSMTSVNSGVSLRSRPVAAPRRQRPFSIAVTGVTIDSDSQASRTSHRHSIAGELRASKAPSSTSDKDSAKPPLPKVHTTKKPSSHGKPEPPARKSVDKLMKSAKASPRATPKATPLTSPGSEAPPTLLPSIPAESKQAEKEPSRKHELASEKTSGQETKPTEGESKETQELEAEVTLEAKQEVVEEQASTQPQILEEEEKTSVPTHEVVVAEPVVQHTEPDVDMSASMLARTRITTEEEAKAALAERRRLAREQAEREAELERQRLEEEARLEEEQLRQEEEEQRRFEEEQLHLVEEARKAEDERLLQAIQENEKREEEERKRKEEEAKAKVEKEEAEKKAREEAERLRREMDERLKKEEEERVARRKRVEAIMLRTRGKGSTPSSTPTKGQNDGEGDADGEVDGEDSKEHSPTEEVKSKPGDLPSNLEQGLVDVDSHQADSFILENGDKKKAVSPSSSGDLLIDNSNGKAMETSEDLMMSAPQSNGHRNGMEYSSLDFVSVDNVKQNNATNNLLDFSEFDAFSTNNIQQPSEFEQILDLSSVPTTGKVANEDNVNSNVMNNGPTPPFIAFQDNLAKKQDNNSVTDLLS